MQLTLPLARFCTPCPPAALAACCTLCIPCSPLYPLHPLHPFQPAASFHPLQPTAPVHSSQPSPPTPPLSHPVSLPGMQHRAVTRAHPCQPAGSPCSTVQGKQLPSLAQSKPRLTRQGCAGRTGSSVGWYRPVTPCQTDLLTTPLPCGVWTDGAPGPLSHNWHEFTLAEHPCLLQGKGVQSGRVCAASPLSPNKRSDAQFRQLKPGHVLQHVSDRACCSWQVKPSVSSSVALALPAMSAAGQEGSTEVSPGTTESQRPPQSRSYFSCSSGVKFPFRYFSSRGQSGGNTFTTQCLNWNKSGEPVAVGLRWSQPRAPLTQETSVHGAEVDTRLNWPEKGGEEAGDGQRSHHGG